MTYYGLYDCDLQGFKSKHASDNLYDLVIQSTDTITRLSESDEEPVTTDIHPVTILKTYNYEIRIISKEEYDKIHNSNSLFLSKTVKDISIGQKFDWEQTYFEQEFQKKHQKTYEKLNRLKDDIEDPVLQSIAETMLNQYKRAYVKKQ